MAVDAAAHAGADRADRVLRRGGAAGGAFALGQPRRPLPVSSKDPFSDPDQDDLTLRCAMQTTPEIAARQHWMGVLARAHVDQPSREQLNRHEAALRDTEYQMIRAPEIGMTLVRGRMGGTGSAFNLGEMSVTRCVVRLADGRTGYSYLAGRDKRHAELAALADAHLQGAQQAWWLSELIEPLARSQAGRRAHKDAETAATKVEFFTLVRGED
ncbi:Phosphonate metabolism protein PhnG [Pseudomonas cannabina pv. alisalensis]|nr:Phosphonate metabolism protein PhnG [Pseudomonas cannabina pv. alisalensis]